MTGKDYQAIAARFRNLVNAALPGTKHSPDTEQATRVYYGGILRGLELAAEQLADYACKNPRFDREKFLAACKPGN